MSVDLAIVEEDGMAHFPIGVKIRLFNYNLDAAIRHKGWTREEAAAHIGVECNTLAGWLGFRHYPSEQNRFSASVALDVPQEEIFPIGIAQFRIKRQPETFPISREDIQSIRSPGPDEEVSNLGLPEAIAMAMETLSAREQLVLRKRFGLGDEEPMTLEALGAELGVTRERPRQIEGKALRKLRHPSRSRYLREFVGLPTPHSPREDKPIFVRDYDICECGHYRHRHRDGGTMQCMEFYDFPYYAGQCQAFCLSQIALDLPD